MDVLGSAFEANHEMSAQEKYEKTAGEIEARDVSARMNLTEEQRRGRAPANDVSAVFVERPFERQYSARNKRLMTPKEYGRFIRNWNSYKAGNYYTRRLNGGIMVDIGSLLVYTDKKGNAEHVLEIITDNIWTDNDIVQRAIMLEAEGISFETA